jgi:hypothetical protein
MENPVPKEEVPKKFKIVEDLFNLAYKVKSYQLQQQHPDWSTEDIHKKTLELIEKGSQ